MSSKWLNINASGVQNINWLHQGHGTHAFRSIFVINHTKKIKQRGEDEKQELLYVGVNGLLLLLLLL
jgi:hypothetical protein